MGVRRISGLMIAVLMLAAVPAVADTPRSLLVRSEGAPQFDVLYHRALTNATGAVIAGLIGAGIQAGIESDKDAAKRAVLKPLVADGVWQTAFERNVNETLRAKGIEPTWVEEKGAASPAKADIYLNISRATYGVRMVDTHGSLVAVYVEFDAVYGTRPPDPRKKSPRENFNLTGKQQVPYEVLLADPVRLNSELEEVLAQAGRRLANKIAYNVQ